LIDRPLYWSCEEEDHSDNGEEKRVLILVPEDSITYEKSDEQHVDRHEQRCDARKETNYETNAGHELETFANVHHEFRRQGQRFELLPLKVRFHRCAVEYFRSMVCHH
jgi:hypothetical protein